MADELIIQRGMWQRLRDYYQEVKIEMKRVTWPSKQEVYGTTIMVLITTFAFAAFFYVCDRLSYSCVHHVLNYFLQRPY
jgi:preprotein translocase subunit SecE